METPEEKAKKTDSPVPSLEQVVISLDDQRGVLQYENKQLKQRIEQLEAENLSFKSVKVEQDEYEHYLQKEIANLTGQIEAYKFCIEQMKTK